MAAFLFGLRLRGRVRGSLLILGVLVLALPGASLAVPTWLAPTTVGAPGLLPAVTHPYAPHVAVDMAGNAVVVWPAADGSVQAAARPAGGEWGAAEQVAAPGQQAQYASIAVDAAGAATAVWQRWTGTNWAISAKTRPAGGAWGPIARQLSTAVRNATFPKLAVNGAGAAVAVWELEESSGTTTVQASTRPAGGSFDISPVNLSGLGEDAHASQVAIDPAGTAVAVWERRDGTIRIVRSATHPAGGAWSAAENLTDPQQNNAREPHVALDAAGNAVANWTGRVAEDFVQVATRPAGAAWGAPESLFAPATDQDVQTPRVAVDPAGNAVAVWARKDAFQTLTAQAATRPAGGAWTAPQDLGEGSPPDVAVDAAGNAVAVWERAGVARAATRFGGVWSTAESVSVSPHAVHNSHVAVDPAGNAVVAWLSFHPSTGYNVQAVGLDAAGPVLAELSIPATGSAGAPLSFSVSPFDVWSALGPGPVWAFGDGTSAAGPQVTHVYGAGGTYGVSVTQADVFGNVSSASQQVSITPAPVAPPEAITPSPPQPTPPQTTPPPQQSASPPPSPPQRVTPAARKCLVPRVVGQKLAKAKAAIKKRNCRVGKIRRLYSKKVRKGSVLSQRPKAGTRLASGARVSLGVSRGRNVRRH